MRSALERVALAVLVSMLMGCVSGPRNSSYWVDFDPPDRDIRVPIDSKLAVAVAGVMQRDSYSHGKADRKILTSPEDLKPLLTGVSSGLIESSSAAVHTLDQANAEIDCPPLKDVKQAPAPMTRSTFHDIAEGQTCVFPDRLENSDVIGLLRLRGIGYLMLLVGEVQEATLGSDFEIGLAGGGPAPALIVNVIKNAEYVFRVSATLYELSSSVAMMKASASAYGWAAYGVSYTIMPTYIAPDEFEYFSSMARAIGLKIGHRFRGSDISAEGQ